MIIDGKDVGEFTYEEKTTDSFGHVCYICKCSVCGKKVTYGKITYHKPICYECNYKLSYKNNIVRRRANTKQIKQVIERVNDILHDKLFARNCLTICKDNHLCQRYNMKCADAIMHWILSDDKQEV